MRVGVVSDTHMFYRAKQLPRDLVDGLKGVHLILHAGDWQEAAVIALFERIAPVDGVAGNNDGFDIIQRFGRVKVLQLAGYRVGLVHGDGGRKTAVEQAADTFKNVPVDVIIFGHSHIPHKKMDNGVLLFNPGSPSDKRRQPRYSYGILKLEDTIQAEIYYYDSKQ